ncbi:unnamed protein product [Ambrosiozyma monospora]|uniref:Unnamed protein product n=1 Tax=Ambrosiozyma monospora TaxID=43982 RepID=A0A9W6Z7E8_AMBMO|nr:unnamed protein product [Ambrosiozyma monospora]
MEDIHSKKFIYLGIPLNGIDWKVKTTQLLKKIPPLCDRPLQVRTLYVNTYIYSAMCYFDQHQGCPKKYISKLIRETNKKIQPSNSFGMTSEKVMTPKYGWVVLA